MLTEKVISTVGSLILTKGRGETSAKSQMVLPMVMSVMPEKQMMSPILASSQGTRFNPSIWYMAVILPR